MDRYIRELRIFTQSFWSPRYEWVQPARIQKLVLVEANNMNGRRCVCPGKSEICFKMKSPGREAGPLGSPDHVYCRAGFTVALGIRSIETPDSLLNDHVAAPCVSIHAAQAVPTQFYLKSCRPGYQQVTDLLH